MRTTLYKISEVPDPTAPRYRQSVGSDARPAIWAAAEGFLRAIGDLPAESATAVIRFVFDPSSVSRDPQSRLSTHIGVRFSRPQFADTILSFLRSGPLCRFYRFEIQEDALGILGETSSLKAACHIYRRDSFLPTHAKFNPHALASYFMCDQFVANSRNDYMALDCLLADIKERVVVDVAVEPADISSEIAAHTRYLSRLQAINQWGDDQDDLPFMTLGGEASASGHGQKSIRPLKQKDPIADDVRQHQDRLQEQMRFPHLRFHIVVLAQSEAAARMVGSSVADAAFQKGAYRVLWHSRAEALSQLLVCLRELRVCDHRVCLDLASQEEAGGFPGLARLPHLATVNELLGAYRLPVAAQGAPSCMRRETDPCVDIGNDFIVLGHDAVASAASSASQGQVLRGLNAHVLTKHMFTSGVPGSGKTTSNLNLLFNLHRLGIPFMVIETAKTEYRAIKKCESSSRAEVRELAKAVEVYSPGNKALCPLRLNPLELLPGVERDAHIDALKTCFLAAMPMRAPLPALLDEGLERVYPSHQPTATATRSPVMQDVLAAVEGALAQKRYAPELYSNLRGALDVRLGSLTRRTMGRLFQCPTTVPSIPKLLRTPCIIELDRLSPEHGCLVSLFLLTAVREFLRTIPYEQNRLRYVILIEEAHNVVGRSTAPKTDNDSADPRAFAAEFVTRMLAELRALGIGIVVSDQLPSAVASEVVKQTTTKLAFRQVAKDDREELGASMLFDAWEEENIARLATGQAFFYTEGYHRPLQIATVNLHTELDLHPPLDDEFVTIVSAQDWFLSARASQVSAELGYLQNQLDACLETCKGLLVEAGRLKPLHVSILAAGAAGSTTAARHRFESEVAVLRECAQRIVADMETGPLARYMPSAKDLSVLAEGIACRARTLQARFDDNVKGAVCRLVARMDGWIDEQKAMDRKESTA